MFTWAILRDVNIYSIENSNSFNFVVCGETESTWFVCLYLAYCTSPGWNMISVEKSVEYELAGEREVLGENLPQYHFIHHKSHMTFLG
jgi:hypothetical protein